MKPIHERAEKMAKHLRARIIYNLREDNEQEDGAYETAYIATQFAEVRRDALEEVRDEFARRAEEYKTGLERTPNTNAPYIRKEWSDKVTIYGIVVAYCEMHIRALATSEEKI